MRLNGEKTRWWWVRHALVPVAGKIVYGRTDVACDTSDTVLFAAQAARLPKDAILVTSGLSRAVKTLEALVAAGYPADPASALVEPAFEERFFGDWENLSWDEIDGRDPGAPLRFWENPFGFRPPGGGENTFDHGVRVAAAVEQLNALYPNRDIVAVAHAGTIRAQIGTVLSLSPVNAAVIDVDFVSISRIDHYHDELEGIARIGAVNAVYV
ncbi:MAG: histidine phosphatase family protein [Rhodospirillaceae bacterium]|nr:histidine phosphatase family protein [Rhodospirillaceae bacterium]